MSPTGSIGDKLARFKLRQAARVGARPRVDGSPRVVGDGRIVIGDDFELRSRPVQSHLIVGQGGELVVGDGVRIESGAAISCQARVEIGDRVQLGAFCMIMDSDFHVAGDLNTAPELRPIWIGAGARLGHRVVVLPGARIGSGTVVLAGSVVSGEVPAGAVVAGNPARPELLGVAAGGGPPEQEVPLLVQRVLGLSTAPAPGDGPDRISAWDSLGALRLVLALEEQFAITLTEDEIRTARTVGDIADRVAAAQRRRQAASVA
jgi:maltose O-acetyltransferase